MTVKREAAFHEAGHAVAAHHSKFHNIVGPINLEDYGSGEIYISLSKSKLAGHGKAADASSARDKEVVADLAVVLAAGLVAERLAEKREPGIVAIPRCALPDHELLLQQLAGAGLPEIIGPYEDQARQLLESEWGLVHKLAEHLLLHVSVPPEDAREFISIHS